MNLILEENKKEKEAEVQLEKLLCSEFWKEEVRFQL
jgi:hypothetical protein